MYIGAHAHATQPTSPLSSLPPRICSLSWNLCSCFFFLRLALLLIVPSSHCGSTERVSSPTSTGKVGAFPRADNDGRLVRHEVFPEMCIEIYRHRLPTPCFPFSFPSYRRFIAAQVCTTRHDTTSSLISTCYGEEPQHQWKGTNFTSRTTTAYTSCVFLIFFLVVIARRSNRDPALSLAA